MKKFGIYSNEDTHPVVFALKQGVLALGHKAIIRNSNPFTEHCVEDFDAVILFGLRGGAGVAHAVYSPALPTIVVEAGYLNREEGYYQISPECLNNPPSIGEYSDNRLKALKISLKSSVTESLQKVSGDPVTPKKAVKTTRVLVCGQQPEDAQHTLSERDLSATFLGIIDRARSKFPKAEIIYRDHPLGRLNVSGYDVYQDPLEVSTEDAISGADAVYTYNSNMGLLALIHGKEVYASEKSLYFQFTKGYSGNNEESFQDFLKRLAHGQFTIEEISSGKPLQTILQSMKVL